MTASLITALAACPVCAANAEASGATAIWPLMLIAPFAVAAIAGIAVSLIWRRSR
jgi:hypothetical protein